MHISGQCYFSYQRGRDARMTIAVLDEVKTLTDMKIRTNRYTACNSRNAHPAP